MEKDQKCIPERQRWIDVYKGIAIALVVLGHLRIGQGIGYRFIFLFHMYAFFFIGGVTYRPKPSEKGLTFLWGTVRRLYIPYVIYATLWVATALAIGLYQGQPVDLSMGNLGKNVLNILLGGGLIPGAEEVGPAWFLCALLCVRVAYTALSRISKHNLYVLGAVAVLCFALAYALEGKAVLPLRLVQSLSAFTFFYVGDLCKKLCAGACKRAQTIGGRLACAMGAAALFGIVLLMATIPDNPVMLVGNTLPDSWAITVIGGGAGCLGLMLLSVAAAPIPGSSVAAYFGVQSMIVMGLHSQIRVVLHLILETLLKLPPVWIEPLTFVLTFAVCLPAAWIIRRFVPVLAGEKRLSRSTGL